MSDAVPPSDLVNVEVNGVPMTGRKGAMIIHVTDANNAYVPRFCYHDKLPIAANCRMCLVEVEKAPKPLPACATPIAEGMKIYTKSPKAIAAQKATMEFLLINHPLDCPICDQGGECELQDLAVGFGRDNSRYIEGKRVVKDKNLGPLVSTDMTRCIHCTRCVRFGQDVAGIQELGTTGRGENMEIGTFIEKSVDHELSGNIIDLCPVGALNSKPFRFRARAWEMSQHPLVSPHDGFGSNLYGHVLRGRLMRVVPRPNEAVNETWIADRDRFSYEGVYSADRLLKPQLRLADGSWRETDWDTAIQAAAAACRCWPCPAHARVD
jgi:NADH-quinone oxidoreductase subunit G